MGLSMIEPKQRIACAIGSYVLLSQEVEQLFKFVIPVTNDRDPSFAAILARRCALERETLGSVSGKFLRSLNSSTDEIEHLLTEVVAERNQIIHHFSSAFGDLLAAENYNETLRLLEQRHQRMRQVLMMLRGLALAVLELMRDGPFRDTLEFDEMATLCASLRGIWKITPSLDATS